MDDSIKPRTPADGPAPEDQEQPAPSAASAIMSNPAQAAGVQATPQVIVQRVLQCLPGLVGAVDNAIKDQVGEFQPFVLLIFAKGTALHSANFNPDVAKKAVIELAQRWDNGEPSPIVGEGDQVPSSLGAAANDDGDGNDDAQPVDGGDPPRVTY